MCISCIYCTESATVLPPLWKQNEKNSDSIASVVLNPTPPRAPLPLHNSVCCFPDCCSPAGGPSPHLLTVSREKNLVYYLRFTHHLLLSLQDTLRSIKHAHLVAAGNSHPVQSISCICAFLPSLSYSKMSSSSSSRTNIEVWCICTSNRWISEQITTIFFATPWGLLQDTRFNPKSENHLH